MTGMRRHYGIAEALGALRPGAQWALRDNDYAKLEWASQDQSPPSLEELEAKAAELEAAEPWRVVREIRDWYLQQSDWTQVQDLRAIRGAEWCRAWDTYRQQLRDITATDQQPHFDQFNMIQGITWPTRPSQR